MKDFKYFLYTTFRFAFWMLFVCGISISLAFVLLINAIEKEEGKELPYIVALHFIVHSVEGTKPEAAQLQTCEKQLDTATGKATFEAALREIEERKDEIFILKQKQLVAQDHIERLSKVCGSWIFDPIRPIQKRRRTDSEP
jgi:hypothetical protein